MKKTVGFWPWPDVVYGAACEKFYYDLIRGFCFAARRACCNAYKVTRLGNSVCNEARSRVGAMCKDGVGVKGS